MRSLFSKGEHLYPILKIQINACFGKVPSLAVRLTSVAKVSRVFLAALLS